MPSESLHLFINPTAGRGRAGRRLDTIVGLLETVTPAVTVQRSCAVGDLEDAVREAVTDGVERIIVAGGDGSIHEAVNGIMTAGGDAMLGIVPTGTGNDFAKACGIPLDWRRATRELAWRLERATPLRRIDLGLMNTRYFANGAGIGFDARVTADARSIRLPLGGIVYLLSILRCLIAGVTTPDMRIEGDCESWQGPLTLANVANGPWIGGLFHIAPPADNGDGHFDLLIAGPVTRRRILTLLPLVMRGRHLAEAEIRHEAVSRLTVTTAEAVPSHLDGEVQPPASRFEIELVPAALGVL